MDYNMQELTKGDNMAKNQFLLPDDLGWKCNDDISKYIDTWARKVPKVYDYGVWQVSKAELMDNIYAIIKRYQIKVSKEIK